MGRSENFMKFDAWKVPKYSGICQRSDMFPRPISFGIHVKNVGCGLVISVRWEGTLLRVKIPEDGIMEPTCFWLLSHSSVASFWFPNLTTDWK